MFMHMELTGKCNLGCTHCYNKDLNTASARSKELAHQEWLRLIRDANALGCERFSFSGGEPLLYQNGKHEMLIELINACNAPVILLTNGHLLTKDRFQKLVGTGKLKAIRLSLDGFDSHNSFRGNGNYKLVLERIRMIKEESEISLGVVTMINNSNVGDVIPLYQRLKEQGVDWWNLDIPFSSGTYKKAPVEFGVPSYSEIVAVAKRLLELYFEDNKPFRLGIANIYKSQIAKVSYCDFDVNMHPCCYRDIICVKPNGEVHACAAYDLKIANVREEASLGATYAVAKANPFYSLKVSGIPECVGCRYLRICGGGCPADSQYLTGSIIGPDPKCCSLLPLVEKEILPILPPEERNVFMSLCNPLGASPPVF